VGWGYVDIEIHTHKSRGLTRADAVLAARFDSRLSPGFQPLP
jgi:pterin-4a-carbinolamine dehydratase